MPKAARTRQGKHHASVKLPQVPTADANHDLPSLNFAESAEAPELVIQQSKKAKQIEKREAFLQKLEPSTKQTSKSHGRRLKRKAKEQLTGGLDDLQSALASLEEESTQQDEPTSTIAGASQDEKTSKPVVKPGTIGKSASSTLSKAQRKRVLELERLRHPLILTNSAYSSNPFQTIRTHAQNTLLAHSSENEPINHLSRLL